MAMTRREVIAATVAGGLAMKGAPIERVETGAIYSNQLSDDPRTALIVAETEGGANTQTRDPFAITRSLLLILPEFNSS